MKTFGGILKEEREKQGKTILEIHRETRIPEKTLVALEANDFTSLPEPTSLKGFIQNYARTLGLDDKPLIAIFNRDWRKQETPKIIPSGLTKPLDQPNSFWTPQTMIILGLSIIITIFLIFIGFQIKNYYASPKLIIDKPQDNETIKSKAVTVSGKTNPDVSVYINEELGNVDEDGNFTYELELFPGENTITVKAVNRHKKTTTVIRKVKKE